MAPPAEPPTNITLRVKVPPGSIAGGADEFTLGNDIPVSLRLGQIRDRIQVCLPSNPTPERQRLLYGGRALVDNEQTLADALNIRRDASQREYVVHLLIKGDGSNTGPAPYRIGAAASNNPVRPFDPNTQQQPQPPPQFPMHHIHHEQAALRAHQRQLEQRQMARGPNPFLNPPTAPGSMPYGMQPMHFGGHMPVMPGAGHPAAPAGFPQAALHGLPQPAMPQNEGLTQHHHGQPQATEDQGPAAHLPPHRPNNEGYHVEGFGPNGERFTVHQHTINVQHAAVPRPHMPPLINGLPPGFPGLDPPTGLLQPPAMRHTALDTARENIAEMRRLVQEVNDAHDDSNIRRARMDEFERRTRALQEYLDPFGVGARTASPQPAGAFQPPVRPNSRLIPDATGLSWQQRAQQLRQAQQQAAIPTNPSGGDVQCYMVSSPAGPYALLVTPQHVFTTQSHLQRSQANTITGPRPTPTTAIFTAGGQVHPHEAAAQVPGQPAPQAQPRAQAAQQNQQGPLAPVMNHVWLLLRILIFAYFLLGSNMGWRRPLALVVIGMGFWMMRLGLLAEGAVLRRWWDGIMNDVGQPAQAQGQQQGVRQDQGQQPQGPQGQGRLRQMPTPEQVAQRLLDEDARVRNQRVQWLRDRIRPVERAAALLVASLWPGVGEAYVRAREQEERRRAEEEVAARRCEEEERQRQAEDDTKELTLAEPADYEDADANNARVAVDGSDSPKTADTTPEASGGYTTSDASGKS